jgi:23S rRNA pseudouridine1911/1915/1917 synthase
MNKGYRYRSRIAKADAGASLLEYLSTHFQHSTEQEWRSRIQEGRVLLDGDCADPAAKLREGQELIWNRPPWREPEAPLCFAVLYRDDNLMAVAKPAGLPTLPGGGFLENTLLALAEKHFPGAAPMHRLGRWTSGLVLLARNPATAAALSRAWRAGKVSKRYRALASGSPSRGEFTVTTPIGPVPHPILGSIHAASPTGKEASTSFTVVEERGGCFLVDAYIATGRPHQIRIHIAAAGYPLVGDPLYGVGGRPAAGCTTLPGDPGYHLHAARVRLLHPHSSKELDLRSVPPPLLREGGRFSKGA